MAVYIFCDLSCCGCMKKLGSFKKKSDLKKTSSWDKQFRLHETQVLLGVDHSVSSDFLKQSVKDKRKEIQLRVKRATLCYFFLRFCKIQDCPRQAYRCRGMCLCCNCACSTRSRISSQALLCVSSWYVCTDMHFQAFGKCENS